MPVQMTEGRDEEGRYTEKYPVDVFLEAIKALDVSSTQNIADEVGCSYDLAYRKLKDLQDKDKVESREVGTAFVWLRAD